MSRLALVVSLIASLSAAAFADRVAPSTRFAQPPPSAARAEFPVEDQGAPIELDRAAIRAKLAVNRAANLMRFRVYQNKGAFPNNTFRNSKLNVWLDDAGNFCAAATIIKLSGQDALVNKVAEQSNFIRLADVTQGPLMDWILTSGLTQAEIAAIQEPMMPVYREVPEPAAEPILVDRRLRQIEDKRLMAKYKQVDAAIVKNKNASLDAATDRLMKNPDVAWAFLAS